MAFEHGQTKMLKLTGFMEGETPTTFMMRLPAQEQRMLLYYDKASQNWQFRQGDIATTSSSELHLLTTPSKVEATGGEYAIFEKKGEAYYIVDWKVNQIDP